MQTWGRCGTEHGNDTPALCSSHVALKYRLWHRLLWLPCVVVSLSPSRQLKTDPRHVGNLKGFTFLHIYKTDNVPLVRASVENDLLQLSGTFDTRWTQTVVYCLKFLSRNCRYCAASLTAAAWFLHRQSYRRVSGTLHHRETHSPV